MTAYHALYLTAHKRPEIDDKPEVLGFYITLNNHVMDKMRSTKFFLVLCLIGLASLGQYAQSQPLTELADKDYPQLRLQFLIAEKALKTNFSTLDSLHIKALQGYPLYPYLEQIAVLQSGSTKDLIAFYEKYKETPLARDVKNALVDRAYLREDWDKFLSYYRYTGNEKRHCKYLSLLWNTNPTDDVKDQVYRYWLHGESRHADCDQVFDKWSAQTKNFDSKAWRRIQLAISNNQYSLAEYLTRYVSPQRKQLTSEWIALNKKTTPDLNLTGDAKDLGDIYYAILTKHKWSDPDYIVSYLLDEKIPLSLQQTKDLQHQVALSFAVKQHPKARYWLLKSLKAHKDPQLEEWLARVFLYQQNWDDLAGTILQYDLTTKDAWQYWLAQSLNHQNVIPQSETIFENLAGNRSYYGFLSAVQSKKPINLNETNFVPDVDKLSEIGQIEGVKRARELFLLDRQYTARREWFYALKTVSGEEYPYFAYLAYQWKWYDRAISLLSGGEYHDVISMRFPTAKLPEIMSISSKHQMAPDWISAIIRQESAYREDARSPVGALGLMQLMPGTAKATYKELYQSNLPARKVFEPAVNIDLGTYYLGKQFSEFNHFVPATAAYNVGPHRVKRWIEDMPSDNVAMPIWIETMPWKETRHYVKNVTAFRVIYALFHNSPTTFLSELITSTINKPVETQ